METTDKMALVARALTLAREHGLEVEVILTALESMKRNPNLSIEEALEKGFGEWIK